MMPRILTYIGWLFVIGSFTIYSCKRCYNCKRTKPAKGQLEIDLSYDSGKLTIYKGSEVEEGTEIRTGYVSGTSFDTMLPVEQNYSAKARYEKEDRTIIAIDGDEYIDVENDDDDCESPCYKVDEGELNL